MKQRHRWIRVLQERQLCTTNLPIFQIWFLKDKSLAKWHLFLWATSLLCFARDLWLQLYGNLCLSDNCLPQFFLRIFLSIFKEWQLKIQFFVCFTKTLHSIMKYGFFERMRQTFVALTLLYRAVQNILKKIYCGGLDVHGTYIGQKILELFFQIEKSY